ncbi:MAG: hypothetical protein EF813_08415 [Methanosarcinales archaeon]|nr:MAG: hypothetical protein EF813_08415 [Methanosarcinales archaeon]
MFVPIQRKSGDRAFHEYLLTATWFAGRLKYNHSSVKSPAMNDLRMAAWIFKGAVPIKSCN